MYSLWLPLILPVPLILASLRSLCFLQIKLHLKCKAGNTWEYSSSNLTGVYLDILHEIATSGTTVKDKNGLLTGIGKESIGVEIVKGLLSGGDTV